MHGHCARQAKQPPDLQSYDAGREFSPAVTPLGACWRRGCAVAVVLFLARRPVSVFTRNLQNDRAVRLYIMLETYAKPSAKKKRTMYSERN